MQQSKWALLFAIPAFVMMAPVAEAQITVTVEKQIEAGSDQTAVFDFPGVGVLGDGQSASYMFGPGGVSLVFEQPPDATWQAPTINCETTGMVSAVVSGPFEVTITDNTGGTSAGSADCTFTNRQAPAAPAPATPVVWLALLALAALSAGILAQRGLARR